MRVYLWPPEMAEAAGEMAAAPALPDKPSVVVLPFDNMSGDPAQDYFADGVVEALTAALSRIRSFFVIARNSAFAYKGTPKNVGQIGRELGVADLLEGSVQRAPGRLRITVQLIETSTGNHLWAQRYDGTDDEVFELQDWIGCAGQSLHLSLRFIGPSAGVDISRLRTALRSLGPYEAFFIDGGRMLTRAASSRRAGRLL